MEQLPERHIECSECKKPIHTIYTEIIGKTMYRLSMCADCPILHQKLYGVREPKSRQEALKSGFSCGGCDTSADQVKMGAPLGCSLCYEVFDNILSAELSGGDRLLLKPKTGSHPLPVHLGRHPGQVSEINPASKLLSLHQSLHETLAREDYEAAAWLRDQIKALTEQDEQKQ